MVEENKSNEQREEDIEQGSLSNLYKDLEIEAFTSSSAGHQIDVSTHIEVAEQLRMILQKWKTDEEEISNCERNLKDNFLDQDILLQKSTLQISEIGKLSLNLKEKNAVSKNRGDKAQQANVIIQYEFERILTTNDELQKQSNTIMELNDDIVRPEMEKLKAQMQDSCEEVATCYKKIADANGMAKELEVHLIKARSDYDTLTKVLEDQKTIEASEISEPEDDKRDLKLIKAKILLRQTDMQKIQMENSGRKVNIQEKDIGRKETSKICSEVKNDLAIHRIRTSQKKDDVASFSKGLAIAQAKCHMLATSRLHIELALREVNGNVQHEKTSSIIERKHLERTKRVYLKKKYVAEKASELVVNLKVQLQENSRILRLQEGANTVQMSGIDEMKDTLNIKITRLLQQEQMEKSTKDELETIIDTLDRVEVESARWRTEGKKFCKIVSILNAQRDTRQRRTKNITSSENEALEMIKLKNLFVLDLQKTWHETNNRIGEYNVLYDTLKNERDEIVAARMASDTVLSGLKQKLEDSTTHLQNIRAAQEAKMTILLKEKDGNEDSKAHRAILHVEKTKSQGIQRDKRDEVEKRVVKANNLKAALASAHRDMVRLHSQNDRLAGAKRTMAEQLESKKYDIQKLLQRAIAYEQTLKKGELRSQERKEDIRALSLQCADIMRHISAKQSLYRDTPEYEKRLIQLQGELLIEVKQGEENSGKLEDPTECERWRELGGEDPDDEQLSAKINILLQRLSENKEMLLDREISLEEITEHMDESAREMRVATIKTHPAIKKLNDLRRKTSDITRSMMALVSELSMYQATALKLEEDKEQQEESLKNAREFVSNGKPPSEEAFKELERLERERSNRHEHSSQMLDRLNKKIGHGRVYYPAKYALRTTAEPRPTAYVPDIGMELPKPYGSMAPFKPYDCSTASTMRHIRPPL